MWKPLSKEEYKKYILSKPKPIFQKRLTYEEYLEKNKRREIELKKTVKKKNNL